MIFDLQIPNLMASLPGRVVGAIDDADDLICCTSCGVDKPDTEFITRDRGYRRKHCRECMAARARAWNVANRQRYNANQRAMRKKGLLDKGLIAQADSELSCYPQAYETENHVQTRSNLKGRV